MGENAFSGKLWNVESRDWGGVDVEERCRRQGIAGHEDFLHGVVRRYRRG